MRGSFKLKRALDEGACHFQPHLETKLVPMEVQAKGACQAVSVLEMALFVSVARRWMCRCLSSQAKVKEAGGRDVKIQCWHDAARRDKKG